MPFGEKYAPIIKIVNPWNETRDYWSAFVVNKERLSENETLSEIEYLSSMAPDNIAIGVEFELREGDKLVAKGVVLEDIYFDI